jgi:hypothetical protein
MNRHVIGAAVFCAAATVAMSAQPPQGGAPAQVRNAIGALEFLSGDNIPIGPIIPDAPYSAEASTSSTQTLADGTNIVRTVTARLYRDSQGRVRREQTVLGLGALDPNADAQPIVTIVDPVAGTNVVLDPRTLTARRLPAGRGRVGGSGLVRRPIDGGEARGRSGEPGEGGRAGGMRRGGPPPDAPIARGRMSAGSPPPPPPPPPGPEGWAAASAPESLGTRTIEGVEAQGTRLKFTIAAGSIGNDRPIEITDERWVAPALGLLVLSRHHDPRTGDVEYRLTNIRREEPPHDLFEIPANYTIVGTPER